MSNSASQRQRKYPIDLVVRVFPITIAAVVLTAFSHVALTIFLAIKFGLPAEAAFAWIFVVGIPLCYYVYFISIIKWQIWAYNSVEDIRELDSMQCLLHQLCIEDYNDKEFWMSKKDIAERKAILERYYGPYQFKDDVNVPNETVVTDVWMGSLFNKGGNLILNDQGIESPNGTYYTWENIWDEEVIVENVMSNQKRHFLSYKVQGERIRLPLNRLGIDYIQLKHALYVYRVRYDVYTQKVANPEIENTKPQYINKPVPYNVGSTLSYVLVITVYKFLKLPQIARVLMAFMLFVTCVGEFMSIAGNHFYHQKLNEHYSGIVTEKKYYQEAHGAKYITVEGHSGDINISNTAIYDTISVGDYISKKEGELKQIIVKEKDTLIFDDEDN
ncbi:hypothetical protein CJD36_006450 [Flavipsychrobacter stenotrophus]|uniref:Uncharacterized protein n=1 Tax=Flavipsychrobacter stenotrophus TaxID=2077091 RepID=A0A2S7SXJ7_9BACT|nr:hypothetical protein [Flavipsychrobacter stenotrophus]PQJ11438.1 hypothetical protein CJD36_006450 [Flavipsychrobacter stenotrophus]